MVLRSERVIFYCCCYTQSCASASSSGVPLTPSVFLRFAQKSVPTLSLAPPVSHSLTGEEPVGHGSGKTLSQKVAARGGPQRGGATMFSLAAMAWWYLMVSGNATIPAG